MAYFQQRTAEEGYTHSFQTAPPLYPEEAEYEPDYDDGFDALMEEEVEPVEAEPALSEEEIRDAKRRKYRIAAGFGDFGAVLLGVVAILILVAFLINMIQFISNDFRQNFSLLQTRL